MPLLLLLACTTAPLSESWQIDRLRVLAVAAEPAEPRPGDTVTFDALVVSPVDGVAATLWFACLDTAECQPDGASIADVDPEAMDAEDYDALVAAGFIGADPYLPPVWQVPEDALDGLAPEDRLEGRTALVNLAAIPDVPDPGVEDVEVAFKRIPISEATTPNHNPAVATVTVDGVEVPPGTTVSLDRGQTYTLAYTLGDDSVEAYDYVNAVGVVEQRTEEPYTTWYAQEGSFDQPYDIWPEASAEYTAPDAPNTDTGGIWLVVRDRRGGMAWTTLSVRYR